MKRQQRSCSSAVAAHIRPNRAEALSRSEFKTEPPDGRHGIFCTKVLLIFQGCEQVSASLSAHGGWVGDDGGKRRHHQLTNFDPVKSNHRQILRDFPTQSARSPD